MLRQDFHQLLKSLPSLSPHQLRELNDSVAQMARQNEVRELVAEKVFEHKQCPHCGAASFCRWGTTGSGEQRYPWCPETHPQRTRNFRDDQHDLGKEP